jgi:hypothetical protein
VGCYGRHGDLVPHRDLHGVPLGQRQLLPAGAVQRQIVLLVKDIARRPHQDQVVRDQFIQCFHITGEHRQAQRFLVLPNIRFHSTS